MKAIGVDLVENQRIKQLLEKSGERFLTRVFTPQERHYCANRITSLAARWAAKEAMGKAFGTGIGDMAFKEIEILNDERGRPYIRLHGAAKTLADSLGFEHIAVSLSHTENYAIAFVVVD